MLLHVFVIPFRFLVVNPSVTLDSLLCEDGIQNIVVFWVHKTVLEANGRLSEDRRFREQFVAVYSIANELPLNLFVFIK